MPNPKFRVAICGGGVGGLALAAFIHERSDVVVDIYEGKPQISTIGDGIAIWKRSWQVLRDIGLDKELEERKFLPPKDGDVRGPICRKSDQLEEGYDFHSLIMPNGPSNLPRPVLLDMLQAKLGNNCQLHTSKHLTGLKFQQADPGAIMEFSDGTVGYADIVVGADGVRSVARESLYRHLAAGADKADAELYERLSVPKWSGTVVYRGSILSSKLKEMHPEHRALLNPQIWCGKNKHVVSYPLSKIIYLVCYHAIENAEGTLFTGRMVESVPEKEVIDCYKDWEPELCSMLELLEKPSRWAIHVVDPLPLSTSGRVVLLGDAAHAMTPHQGVGGGQAIEDAHILGRLLSHPDTQLRNIEDVLRIYQEIRLPLAQRAAERSRLSGLMYEFNHPDHPIESTSSKEEFKKLGNIIRASFGWLAEGGCDEDWIRAEAKLKEIAGHK